MEAAGPWNASLCYDQDGEYFARVLKLTRKARDSFPGRRSHLPDERTQSDKPLGEVQKEERVAAAIHGAANSVPAFARRQPTGSQGVPDVPAELVRRVFSSPPHILAEIDAHSAPTWAEADAATRRELEICMDWSAFWLGCRAVGAERDSEPEILDGASVGLGNVHFGIPPASDPACGNRAASIGR